MNFGFLKQDWFVGLAVTLLMAMLAATVVLQPLEWWAYDQGMRISAPRKASDRLVIIALDDAAVDRYGAWPWPPGLLVDFFARLHAGARPRAIGVMPSFEFPVNEQGLDFIRRLRTLQDAGWSSEAAGLLTQAEAVLDDAHDLSASITAAGNVVLAIPQRLAGPAKGPADIPQVLVRNRLRSVDTGRDPPPPVAWEGFLPPALPDLSVAWSPPPQPVTAAPVPPQPLLGRAAAAVGYVSRDDSAAGVRQQPLVFKHRGLYLPAFSLVMTARTLGLSNNQIAATLGEGIRLGKREIPTDPQLRVWPYFYDMDIGSPFETYSILDVLDGRVAANVFDGRTVLIGPTTPRLVSLMDTPVGQSLPPVLVEAHVISSLLNGYVYDVRGWAWWSEALALLAVALYIMFVLPRLRTLPAMLLTLGIAAILANLQFILMNTLALRVQFVLPIVVLLAGHLALMLKHFLQGRLGRLQAELSETRRRLGEAYQAQSHLDLAFDMYRRCLTSDEVLQHLFDLGLDYERRRKFSKAISAFKHIQSQRPDYPGLDERIRRNQELDRHFMLTGGRSDPIETAMLDGDTVTKPMIGRYQIEKIIGRGAMGVVYLGRDKRIGRIVAVKTLALAHEFEGKQLEDVTERFYREAETAGRLNHPNIVTIYDVGEEHDLAYIAMDFLTGENLQVFCTPAALLPVDKVLDIGAQVAEALDYAHGRNVVHRDIKPANIIYDAPSGRVKVTDFGVAYLTDASKTKTGTILGSPSYMSPEQVSGKRVDGRSDLFSLGVTLFELLTGELPFVGEPIGTLMYRIANEPHTDLKDLRPDLQQCIRIIMNKALQKDPNKRYQTGMAMANALRRCLKNITEAA